MNLEEIQKLVKMLDESGLGEMAIEEGEFKITLKRQAESPASTGGMNFLMPQMIPQMQTPSASPQPASQTAQPASAAPASTKYKEIRSPIVGTFYRAPSPEAAPYTQVGDKITKGKVLCIVEAMKLMNEIESDIDGTIVKILVENGQPIEYDQPLFHVE